VLAKTDVEIREALAVALTTQDKDGWTAQNLIAQYASEQLCITLAPGDWLQRNNTTSVIVAVIALHTVGINLTQKERNDLATNTRPNPIRFAVEKLTLEGLTKAKIGLVDTEKLDILTSLEKRIEEGNPEFNLKVLARVLTRRDGFRCFLTGKNLPQEYNDAKTYIDKARELLGINDDVWWHFLKAKPGKGSVSKNETYSGFQHALHSSLNRTNSYEPSA